MSYVAKRDVKAVLTGEGADELFCGYPKYSLANTPSVLRSALRLVGSAKASRIAGFCGFDERKALTVARALSPRNELDRIVQWFSEIERSRLQQLLPGIGWEDSEWAATTEWQRLAFESFANEDTTMKMQAVDCLTWLPGNLLERGDRMTMAASLEARVPFLDKELVAFSFGLRRSMKLRGKTRKWIVRQWGRQLLPNDIAQRRKASFQVPLNAWFRGEMKDSLHAYLTSPNGLMSEFGDVVQVQDLLDAHHSGTIDASRALWSLLTIEIWYQDVFQKNTRA
jgi:asparagine synthase (glutamine-hydrolysing)